MLYFYTIVSTSMLVTSDKMTKRGVVEFCFFNWAIPSYRKRDAVLTLGYGIQREAK